MKSARLSLDVAPRAVHYSVYYSPCIVCTGRFVLVYWEEEESVSVVLSTDIVQPPELYIGCDCSVRICRSVFSGKVAAIGKCTTVMAVSVP